MKNILVNPVVLFLALLLSVFYTSADTTQATDEKNVQACVLYGTNKNNGFPIPQQKCVEVLLGINCDEKVVDSKNSNKIWRSYPLLDCSDPNIEVGLSERYLLEGVDW